MLITIGLGPDGRETVGADAPAYERIKWVQNELHQKLQRRHPRQEQAFDEYKFGDNYVTLRFGGSAPHFPNGGLTDCINGHRLKPTARGSIGSHDSGVNECSASAPGSTKGSKTRSPTEMKHSNFADILEMIAATVAPDVRGAQKPKMARETRSLAHGVAGGEEKS